MSKTIDAPYPRMPKALGLIGLLENACGRSQVIRVALQFLGVGRHRRQPRLQVGHKTVRHAGELIASGVSTPRGARSSNLSPQRRHMPCHRSTQTRQAISDRTHPSRVDTKLVSHRLISSP
jgi:hypothetical protein